MTSRGRTSWDIGALPLIAPEVLGGILADLADVALVVARDGRVLSVLGTRGELARADPNRWKDADLRAFLTIESVSKFDRALTEAGHGGRTGREVELNHDDPGGGAEFPVVYTFHPIGPGGEIMMLGRDLRQISDAQQQLVNAQLALERDYELQRESETRFRVLMATTRDAIVIVSVATGRIAESNGAAATLLGRSRDELENAPFAAIFEDQDRAELMADMAAAALAEGVNVVDVTVRGSRRALQAAPSFFRAQGTRMMLCRLTAAFSAESGGDDLATGLMQLYEAGPEAIVFTDRDGQITAANESFLGFTDAAHGIAVRGRSLGEFMDRGSVDLKVLLENAARFGRMRMYATKLHGEFQAHRAVELSVTHLRDGVAPAFVFVMRDATIGDTTRALRHAEDGGEDARSVVDLVGSATLKEIVADTTEVIERMCIETAVDLTSNNRVAAAEMLGLSRQSLYVKLRKYGLLSQPGGE